MTTQISGAPPIRLAGWGGRGVRPGPGAGRRGRGNMYDRLYDPDMGLRLATLLYACVGALGGAVRGFATGSRANAGLFALGGALGFGVGYLLTDDYVLPLLAGRVSFAVAHAVQYAIIGACIGALLGAARNDVKLAGRLALRARSDLVWPLWRKTLSRR